MNDSSNSPIQRLRPTHDAIMDFMLMNPGATLAEMGHHFGYTPAWLSTVINSDLFQARLSERRAEIEEIIHNDIPAQMRGIVGMGLEKIAAHMERSQDMQYVTTTTDKLLHRLGYAPKSGVVVQSQGPTQNNFFLASPEDLAKARERIVETSMAASALAPPEPSLQLLPAVELPQDTPPDIFDAAAEEPRVGEGEW